MAWGQYESDAAAIINDFWVRNKLPVGGLLRLL